MKLYTYGIIDSNTKISDSINGLEEARAYNVPYRDIGVVVSEFHPQTNWENKSVNKTVGEGVNQAHILKHEEVVERLMEDFTVLPMRFLTLFDREENLLLMMKEYYEDFRGNLDRLRNKVELGIKVIWHGETIRNRIIDAFRKSNANMVITDSSPEKSFVRKKFEKYRVDKEFEEEADRCIAIVDDFFNRFVCQKKLEKLKSENLLLNAFYLVEKEKQKDFKEAFERIKSSPCDLKYLFSGPWPPYNFIVLTPPFLATKRHCEVRKSGVNQKDGYL